MRVSVNQIFTNFGLESAKKYEENETKLNLLAQTVSKWQPVEAFWTVILQTLESFIFNTLTSTGCHFEMV